MKDYHALWQKMLQKSKTILNHPLLFFGLLGLCLLLLLLAVFLFIQKALPVLKVKNDPFLKTQVADYPLLERMFAPVITAQAAFIMDNTSKVILFAKNENVRFSPASTTKIMTTLIALNQYKLGDELTVKRTGIEPVVVGFPLGAKVTFSDALYGLLLPSGNDVAYMLADNYPGGFTQFVKAMNQKAQQLHLANTHYGDPAGLIDDEDYTTVKDLALLASYAIENPILAQVVDTKERVIHDSFGNTYDVKNLNELLGKYGVNGIKTGYTGEAGEVLVTSAVIHGHTFIIVVMKSQDRFADTEKLLQLLSNNVSFVSIHP